MFIETPAAVQQSSAADHLRSTTSREYDRVANIADRFDLSRATLYRLEERGDIRMVKVGGRTLIEVASVRSYLANLPKRRGA